MSTDSDQPGTGASDTRTPVTAASAPNAASPGASGPDVSRAGASGPDAARSDAPSPDAPNSQAAIPDAPTVDEAIRGILLLMPRLVGRAKRLPIPADLRSFNLASRHLSLLSYLIFDGPLAVNELAARLEVAPATVSLMVSDLSRQGVLDRRADEADRRRAIVSIAESHQAAVEEWLAGGSAAWRKALAPLTPTERQTFVETLRTYEREMAENEGGTKRAK